MLLIAIVPEFNQRLQKKAYIEKKKTEQMADDTRILPDEPEMIFVEGGSFLMGYSGETVTVDSFHIGKYEVTQKQWTWVMRTTMDDVLLKANNYISNDPVHRLVNPKGVVLHGVGNNYPIYLVDLGEVREFIRRLNEITGKQYRLPTDAEWIFAARGGNKSKGYIYSGSNNLDDVAWHNGNCRNKMHPVGLKQPNELGIYDMTGNVMEWCQDLWVDDYQSGPHLKEDDKSIDASPYRFVMHGGNFRNDGPSSLIEFRRGAIGYIPRMGFGFRLVHP